MAHRLSARAEADLDEIWWRIAEQSGSPDRARRIVEGITERFSLLALYPYSGRARADLRPGLRSLATGNHVIFYRIDGSDVVILRVLDGRRDLPRLLR